MHKVAETQGKGRSHTSVFVMMALDMSWRLAVVVLVPIVGGFKLDQGLDTGPIFTILGFILAMVGMGLIMWRTLKEASKIELPKEKRS